MNSIRLEKKIQHLLAKINEVNVEIVDTLRGRNDRIIYDIRYYTFFLDELEEVFNFINAELDLINQQLYWTEPTRKLENLRNQLIRQYELMYKLFDDLVVRIEI